MLLYFMRHGEAEEIGPEGDAGRRLTERGVQRTRQAGDALTALDVQLDLILTSPLRRAEQTAEIVAAALGAPVHQADELAGRLGLPNLQLLLGAYGSSGAVMLVGHEPDFSAVIGDLIGGASVEMKKGAVACLDCQAIVKGGATLLWLATGRQLALMAR
jgi:phosphohistidine phosphatase